MRAPYLPNGWVETRRAEAAQRRDARGLGFLDSRAEEYYYEDEWGWYYWDGYNGYWGDNNGGYADTLGNSSGWWADDSVQAILKTLDWWANLDNTIVMPDSTAPFLPNNTSGGGLPSGWPTPVYYDPWAGQGMPSYRDITGDLDYQTDYGSLLPGYCPKGSYHPLNDPYSCVPFPPKGKNSANPQQQAAQQARKQQQQQDKQCPKDPQGRPVWRNPQTGKCELAPQCPQGSRFDSTSRRCLTPAQFKQAYGDNSWLWWLLGGGAALLLLTRDNGGRRR